MDRSRFALRIAIVTAAALALRSPPSLAQGNAAPADGRARLAVLQGTNAYQNLDVDGAVNELREALRRCGRNRCSPRLLADVHATLGVVLLGGRNDADGAAREFTAAVQANPGVAINPAIATQEANAALGRARRAYRGTVSLPALMHRPIEEQLERTPVPVHVEVGSNVAQRLDLFYRQASASTWSHVAMTRVGRGWGAEIPCTDVLVPSVEYYVTAYDDSDVPTAEAGNEDGPLRVEVVTTRTRPSPSMPGALPPEQCADPNARHAAGEACTDDPDCGDGLLCIRRVCTPRRDAASAAAGPTPMLAADLGFGLGFGFLGGEPGYAEAEPVDPANPTGPATCRMVSCPREVSGVAVMPYIFLGARYNITPNLGAALSVRWQPDSAARTTLASLLISLRGYYAFIPWRRTGLSAAAFVGTGVGQIQPRATMPSASMPGAQTGHIVTGLNNINFGGRVEYGVIPQVHIGGELTFQIMFPRTLFVIDLQIFAGVHF